MTSDAIFGAVVAIETAWLGALTALALNRRRRSLAPIIVSLAVFIFAYFAMLIWNQAVQSTAIAVARTAIRATPPDTTRAVDALYFGWELITAAIVGSIYCSLLPKVADYVNPDRDAGDLD
ncbi:hypothetical protein [Sphingomonas sp. PAMC 26605]|uniref:hypothetical protein n=1 Tax=Sphingomonas sp. PAMC 26605 TaxID=1112214 RepID=UPI00026CAC3C|nr:hypothetical protein [Sphingomonas sp. PAMC 26605]